jgi:hypothetical protein
VGSVTGENLKFEAAVNPFEIASNFEFRISDFEAPKGRKEERKAIRSVGG